MKIAVLGARGFVGSNIARYFTQKNHHVTAITRDTLDLLDSIAVKDFLKTNYFDVVINCASIMTNDLTITDARNNLGMFMNFYNNADLFGKFINTGSGAEFDRSMNINLALETTLFTRMPKDSYGWGQNIKSRLCYDKKDFYTIRIFNCFGQGEISTRIFPQLLAKKQLDVTNDRYFDYFSIQDLCSVVDHCTEYTWSKKDVNAVYEKKYKISQALNLFCEVNNLSSNINVASTSDNNYTGSGHLLNSMGINLKGLEYGFREYLK